MCTTVLVEVYNDIKLHPENLRDISQSHLLRAARKNDEFMRKRYFVFAAFCLYAFTFRLLSVNLL